MGMKIVIVGGVVGKAGKQQVDCTTPQKVVFFFNQVVGKLFLSDTVQAGRFKADHARRIWVKLESCAMEPGVVQVNRDFGIKALVIKILFPRDSHRIDIGFFIRIVHGKRNIR